MSDSSTVIDADVVRVGAGIMCTTLAVFLKVLQPHLKLVIIERL
ncbi:MAG: malate:quinone oxidoreductase, partial [Reyranella sp.]